jgi:hypothetical protein
MHDPKLTTKHPRTGSAAQARFQSIYREENRRLTDAKPMRLTVKHRSYMFSLHIWEEAGGSHILDSKPQFRSDATLCSTRLQKAQWYLLLRWALTLTIVRPHSIRRRLNSYNFDAGFDYGKTTGSKRQKLALWCALLLWDSCALFFSRLICCFLTAPQTLQDQSICIRLNC